MKRTGPLRWGIMGTGNIARQFSQGVAGATRSALAAVGSRTRGAADAFAKAHAIPGAHESYEALLADRDVDAIYLSLPNSMHHEWTLKSLAAGKHVLCEKPFALDAAQSEEMFDAARNKGLLLVEAFMYRSHPQTHAILKHVRDGESIGRLKLIRTSFCYCTSKVDGNVRFDRKLGGGSLMDVGCYCINFSRMIAGAEPTKIFAAASFHEASGVDETVAATMQFPGGVQASFTCGMRVQADNTAQICGDAGYIELGWPWKPPATGAQFTIAHSAPPRQDVAGGGPAAPPPRRTVTIDAGGSLYGIEADDFAAAVAGDKSPALGEADTLGNMRVLDEIRRQIGLRFD